MASCAEHEENSIPEALRSALDRCESREKFVGNDSFFFFFFVFFFRLFLLAVASRVCALLANGVSPATERLTSETGERRDLSPLGFCECRSSDQGRVRTYVDGDARRL